MSQGPSNINGARTQESLITYDGAPAVRTRSNGSAIGAADVDSTQEIQILTADYAAEYGRSSGGQIRIITRSGTQQFHGAAYDYIRNDVFNANTWTRNHTAGPSGSPAPINYNQFGYNVGGPFYIPGKFNTDKTKVFWYWGQEWVRYRFTDTQTSVVPTMLMRQGDFSELLDPTNFFYGKVGRIKDPATGNPFPNNIIPKGQLSPNGLGILNVWPLPNQATPLNGNQNWYLVVEPSATPAQGHAGRGLQPDGHAAPAVPPQQLRVLGISAAGRRHQRNAEILQPPEPDQLAEPRLDARAEQGERSSGDVQPGRCVHSGGRGELPRPDDARAELSVHFPAGKADPDPHPDGQHDEYQHVERRTVSVALVGPDLRHFGQLHVDQGQPHA